MSAGRDPTPQDVRKQAKKVRDMGFDLLANELEEGADRLEGGEEQ